MRDTSIYKDLNQFSPTKRPFSTDTRAIYQSVLNVIRVSFSAIPFTTWGADLEDELFELYDSEDATGLLFRISGAIEDIERNITVDKNQSSIQFLDSDYSLRIILVFEIEGIEDQKFEINEIINL